MRLDKLAAVALVLGLAGCKKDAPPPPPAPVPPPAAAGKAAAGSGTDGGGNGTGANIANARALRNGQPASFTLSCEETLYFGPFTFTRDPQTLTLNSSTKTPSGAQICPESEFLDASGKHVGGGALACVDGTHVTATTSSFEYSPGNGGAGANPIYFRVRAPGPKQPNCPKLDVTLSVP